MLAGAVGRTAATMAAAAAPPMPSPSNKPATPAAFPPSPAAEGLSERQQNHSSLHCCLSRRGFMSPPSIGRCCACPFSHLFTHKPQLSPLCFSSLSPKLFSWTLITSPSIPSSRIAVVAPVSFLYTRIFRSFMCQIEAEIDRPLRTPALNVSTPSFYRANISFRSQFT